MYRKLITACMAIAAFAAFVLPATASATNDPQLTDNAGNMIAKGTLLEATNLGETTFTNTSGTGLIHCSNALMTGEVVKNEGGTVEGTIWTADFWGTGAVHNHNNTKECTGLGGAWITVVNKHLCIRSTPTMATDEFQVTGGACPGTEKVKFIIGSTTAGECEYESTGAVKGDYKTLPEDAVMTVFNTQEGSGSKKIRGGIFCPSSGMLNMSFTLKTDPGGVPVYIS